MFFEHKFLKVKYRSWWIVFFCIQAALIALMIAALGVESWVYSDNDMKFRIYPDYYTYYDYEGDAFETNLYKCEDGCSGTFKKLKKEYCDFYDEVKDIYEGYEWDDGYIVNNVLESICLMYTNLYSGMGVYVAFQVLAIVSVIFWALGMILLCKSINSLWLTFLSVGLMWCFQYIGFIAYMGLTNSNFSGDCDKYPNDGTAPKLCAASGPGLSLFIVLVIPFISIFYFLVAFKFYKIYRNERNTHQPQPVIINPQIEMNPQFGHLPVVMNPQAGVNYPVVFYPQSGNPQPGYPPAVFDPQAGMNPQAGNPPMVFNPQAGMNLQPGNPPVIMNYQAPPQHAPLIYNHPDPSNMPKNP